MAQEELYSPNPTKSCFHCGKDLFNVFEGPTNQPSGALSFSSHGHYGSTSFDPMDGSWLEINICDECVLSAAKFHRVLHIHNSRPVVARDPEAGFSVLVGAMKVDTIVTDWTGGDEFLADSMGNPVVVDWDEIGELDPEGNPADPSIEWHRGVQDVVAEKRNMKERL